MRLVERLEIEAGRHRPAKPIAIIEIVLPLHVATQVGARAFDLDDRDAAFGIERHDIGAPPVAERDFAQRHQILPPQQPRDAARDIGGDQGCVGEAIGLAGHRPQVEQDRNAGKRFVEVAAHPRP